MTDAELRSELLIMKSEDEELHTELSKAGALSGHYVPSLQAVHEKNAARLREILSEHGWPHEERVGADGAYAAWLIVQHGVGDPGLQKSVLPLLQKEAARGRVPTWHAAYLVDRIAMYEQRCQRYGTQWLDDVTDGRTRPWPIEEPDNVNSFRASVGLGPLHPTPERGPDLPLKEQDSRRENQRWWQNWLASRVGTRMSNLRQSDDKVVFSPPIGSRPRAAQTNDAVEKLSSPTLLAPPFLPISSLPVICNPTDL